MTEYLSESCYKEVYSMVSSMPAELKLHLKHQIPEIYNDAVRGGILISSSITEAELKQCVKQGKFRKPETLKRDNPEMYSLIKRRGLIKKVFDK